MTHSYSPEARAGAAGNRGDSALPRNDVAGFPEGIAAVASQAVRPTPAGFNIYILDETNRAEVYHHCEGSKEELVRDVSRFYSSSHDRFTYGSSFINFNLPQFYQIVKVDGRAQVIPFRTQVIAAAPANQDSGTPLLQQYFS
jgi:adenylate cyclase